MELNLEKSGRSARFTVLAVAGCVLAAILCRHISTSEPFINAIFDILRPLFYAGLYFAWGNSFRRRIIHKPTLHHLTGIAVLMIFWIFIRSCKYMLPDEMAAALRMGWYLYYIPMLLIPTMGLFLALYMRKLEGYVLPWQMYLLYLPALLFIGFVLTNDLHQLVFRFPEGVPWTGEVYSYGIVYYILAAWEVICATGFLIIILMKCRIKKSRKIMWLPFVAFGICLLYGILSYLHPYFWKVLSGDMTSAFCLLFAMVLESCIQCGLIPSNSNYDTLFRLSDLSAQITDRDYRIYYSAENLHPVSREIMRQTQAGPVMLENGIRLCGVPIQAGYVLWEEDISELQEILEELEDLKEELRDTNLIEEENLSAKKRITQLVVKNQLYDEMQKQVAGQIMLLSNLIDRYPQCLDEKKRRKLLSKIAVVGAYLKRRSNLIFITAQNTMVSVKEVKFCIEESIRNLSLCGADCSFLCCCDGVISGNTAMRIYDCFEGVIEKTLDGLTALSACLKSQGSMVVFRLSVECEASLTDLAIGQGVSIEQDFDGAWLLSLVLPVGGEKYDSV